MKKLLSLVIVCMWLAQGCGGDEPTGPGLQGTKGDTIGVGHTSVTLPARTMVQFLLPLEAGQTVAIVARSLSQPALNSMLWLTDGQGQTVMQSRDTHYQGALPMADLSDAFLVYRAPADDSFLFECRNLSYSEGEFQIDVIALSQPPLVDLTVTNASIRGICEDLRQKEQELTANTSFFPGDTVNLFSLGMVSEGTDGLLAANGASLSDLKTRRDFNALVAAYNSGRQSLFEQFVLANDLTLSDELTASVGQSLGEIYSALRSDR